MELAVASYAVTQRLPPHERHALASQIRRAAVSVPSNIAEGNGRSHRGDYLRHLSIAHGSLRELETQLALVGRLYPTAEAQCRPARELARRTGRLLGALQRSLTIQR